MGGGHRNVGVALLCAASVMVYACSSTDSGSPDASARSDSVPPATGPVRPTTTTTTTTTLGSTDIFVAASDGSLNLSVGTVRVTGAAGSFAAGTAVTVAVVATDLDPALADYVSVAGEGVDVTFPDGVMPAAPLTVSFDVGPSPGPDWVPVSMHQTDVGSWEPVEAASDGSGHITIVTADFSIHLPSWLNPVNWFNSLVSSATNFLGGRTEPGQCPPAGQRPAPQWASVTGPPTGATHVCMFENSDAAGERVEVELRSNRGTYLVVSIPDGRDYVYQDVRSSLATAVARRLHWVADPEWVLAPGDRMTYGYRRTASEGSLLVNVHANNAMIMLSGLSALVGDVVGFVQLVTCFVGDFATMKLTVTSFSGIVDCALSGGADLADDKEALAAVRNLYGSTIDNAALDQQAKLLVEQADKLKGWGRLLKLVSLAQAVIPIWTQMLDALNEALAPGAGDINVVLEPGGAPPSTTPVVDDGYFMLCPDVPDFNPAGDDAVNVKSHAADCEYVGQLIRDLGAQRDWRNDEHILDVINGVSCAVIEESVDDRHAPWWGCEGGGYFISFDIRAA